MRVLAGVPIEVASREPTAAAAAAAVSDSLTEALPGQRKVKYFGKELPPKCALRTCWLTDDGVHFYCVDFTCNRHKYRRTKHDRYSRYKHLDPQQMPRPSTNTTGPAPATAPNAAAADQHPAHLWPLVHFRCPSCGSGDIQMRLLQNRYECADCAHTWR